MQHDVYSCSILNQVCYKLKISLIKAEAPLWSSIYFYLPIDSINNNNLCNAP